MDAAFSLLPHLLLHRYILSSSLFRLLLFYPSYNKPVIITGAGTGRQCNDRICRCHFHAGIIQRSTLRHIQKFLIFFICFKCCLIRFRSVDYLSCRINMIFQNSSINGIYVKIWIILPEFTGIIILQVTEHRTVRILCPYITEFLSEKSF